MTCSLVKISIGQSCENYMHISLGLLLAVSLLLDFCCLGKSKSKSTFEQKLSPFQRGELHLSCIICNVFWFYPAASDLDSN